MALFWNGIEIPLLVLFALYLFAFWCLYIHMSSQIVGIYCFSCTIKYMYWKTFECPAPTLLTRDIRLTLSCSLGLSIVAIIILLSSLSSSSSSSSVLLSFLPSFLPSFIQSFIHSPKVKYLTSSLSLSPTYLPTLFLLSLSPNPQNLLASRHIKSYTYQTNKRTRKLHQYLSLLIAYPFFSKKKKEGNPSYFSTAE